MIRPLHPFDVARYALVGGPGGSNRVYTLDSLGSEMRPHLSLSDAAGLSFSLHGKSTYALACIHGNRVVSISAARPRSGPRTWEFTQLLPASEDESGCEDLLRTICRGVAGRGGERVFIRLRSEDPLVDVTRRCGFVPCAHEVLFKGRHRTPSTERSITVREKRPAHEYGLFRLYNAATPSETRFATGMTFEQWASSREQGGGRRREYVYESDGMLRGWIGTSQRRGPARIIAMIHPEEETSIVPLMDYGLARLTGAPTVYCLVQEHQTILQRLLVQIGYEAVSEYVTLVRSMVTPIRNREARRAATIVST